MDGVSISPKLANLFKTVCLIAEEEAVEAGLSLLINEFFRRPEAKERVITSRETREQEHQDHGFVEAVPVRLNQERYEFLERWANSTGQTVEAATWALIDQARGYRLKGLTGNYPA